MPKNIGIGATCRMGVRSRVYKAQKDRADMDGASWFLVRRVNNQGGMFQCP